MHATEARFFAPFAKLMAIAFAIGACASEPAHPSGEPPAEYLQLYEPGVLWEAKLEGDRLAGPAYDVQRFDGEIRGRLGGVRVVSLSLSTDTVRGLVGPGGLTTLVVTSEGANLRARGQWAGKPASIEWAGTRFAATFAGCGFELERTEGPDFVFRGKRSCPGQFTTQITLKLPNGLVARPANERAAWLGLFLFR